MLNLIFFYLGHPIVLYRPKLQGSHQTASTKLFITFFLTRYMAARFDHYMVILKPLKYIKTKFIFLWLG